MSMSAYTILCKRIMAATCKKAQSGRCVRCEFIPPVPLRQFARIMTTQTGHHRPPTTYSSSSASCAFCVVFIVSHKKRSVVHCAAAAAWIGHPPDQEHGDMLYSNSIKIIYFRPDRRSSGAGLLGGGALSHIKTKSIPEPVLFSCARASTHSRKR